MTAALLLIALALAAADVALYRWARRRMAIMEAGALSAESWWRAALYELRAALAEKADLRDTLRAVDRAVEDHAQRCEARLPIMDRREPDAAEKEG